MPILETVAAGMSSKALTYLAAALGLATAGAVDGVNVAFNHQSMLAETGLPFESQLGLAALFLAGFVFVAFKFLASQDEKFKILTDHIAKMELSHKEQVGKLEDEKKLLIARLTQLNDETRQQLAKELADHSKGK